MAKIFISYSRSNKQFARRLRGDLIARGADVWIDLEDIPAGVKWSDAVEDGLKTSDVMVVILSPQSIQSRNVEDEWQAFRDEDKPIIPILFKAVKSIDVHFQLRRIQYIDFQKQKYDEAFAQLVEELVKFGMVPAESADQARVAGAGQGPVRAVERMYPPGGKIALGVVVLLLIAGAVVVGNVLKVDELLWPTHATPEAALTQGAQAASEASATPASTATTAFEPGRGYFGTELVVTPADEDFELGSYGDFSAEGYVSSFSGSNAWDSLYASTAKQASQIWIQWRPPLVTPGWYEIAAFISAPHATTEQARYKIYGTVGADQEVIRTVAQAKFQNQWVSLGVFQIDPRNFQAGNVLLNNLTGEDDLEIVFDAIRWRQVLGRIPTAEYVADGFDSPVGTLNERQGADLWPGAWLSVTGFGESYSGGSYNPGADLNLNAPFWDADAHAPVYAAASGEVVFAEYVPGRGDMILIRHDPLISTGKVYYSRYLSIEELSVAVGDRVARGQQICKVGRVSESSGYHLHYDISPTDIFETTPDYIPHDFADLYQNFVDPAEFTQENRPCASTFQGCM